MVTPKSNSTSSSFILLSDTETDEEQQETVDVDDSDDDDDEESENEEDTDEEISNLSSSDENSDWSADDDEEEQQEEEEESIDDDSDSSTPNNDPDESSQYDRILHLLKGNRDLEKLKLEECKVYLRKHSLRLTGNRLVCTQRIHEHWRIKDGNGEKLYPRSTFSINCTGDVCQGDVVVFTQKVFGKFEKMKRSGNLLGKRIIAGRVVKESYGSAKQQHTFTVEVLWSKGVKKLPPLSPLLVKGRNLYKLKTFRQRWDNEAERSKVLAEKHKRGAAARELRARKRDCSEYKGSKRKRLAHQKDRSPKRRRNQESRSTTKSMKEKLGGGRGKPPPLKQPKTKRLEKQGVRKEIPKHLRPSQANAGGVPTRHTLNMHQAQNAVGVPTHHTLNMHQAQNAVGVPTHHTLNMHQVQNHPRDVSAFQSNRGALFSSSYDVGSASTAAITFGHYSNTTALPISRQDHIYNSSRHYAYTIPEYHLDPQSFNYYQNQVSFDRQTPSMPFGARRRNGQANGLLRCSTPGCGGPRADNCAVFSCWRCCSRSGRRCLGHQN